MSWFNGNKRLREEHSAAASDSRIEIKAHKEATKEQIQQVKQAATQFNKKFAVNHFTLTIWLAAGGNLQHMTTKETGETSKEWKRVPKVKKGKK